MNYDMSWVWVKTVAFCFLSYPYWFVIWLNPSCVRRLISSFGAAQSKFCSFHRGYHNDSHAHWGTKSIYTPTIVIILSNLSNFFVLTSYLLLAKWLYFGIGVSFKSHTQTNAASSNTLKREDASILDQKWEIAPERMIRNHFRESVSPPVIFII